MVRGDKAVGPPRQLMPEGQALELLGDGARRELSVTDTVRAWLLRGGARKILTAVATLVLSLVAIVLIWQLVVSTAHLQSYVLPAPKAVAQDLWNGVSVPLGSQASLLNEFWTTFEAAMLGLCIGFFGGVLLGGVCAQFKFIERVVMPYVFGFQTMPKIALAPLILIWFGFGQTPKIVLAAAMSFFPVMVNAFSGMTLVNRDHASLFKALGATRLSVLLRLRLPTALPMIFAGLEIAVVEALLGAVVIELIAGQAGIGVQIVRLESLSNTAGIFAALIVLSLAGVILHWIVRFARKKIVFWATADE
jgi:NitT/TauT family transport system permease protein